MPLGITNVITSNDQKQINLPPLSSINHQNLVDVKLKLGNKLIALLQLIKILNWCGIETENYGNIIVNDQIFFVLFIWVKFDPNFCGLQSL